MLDLKFVVSDFGLHTVLAEPGRSERGELRHLAKAVLPQGVLRTGRLLGGQHQRPHRGGWDRGEV